MNQSSKFLESSFSNQDHIKIPVEFRNERQCQHTKRLFLIVPRYINLCREQFKQSNETRWDFPEFKSANLFTSITTKKWSFSLGNSSVHLKKSAVFCGFGWHLLKKSLMANFIFSAVILSHIVSRVLGLEAKSNYCYIWKTGPYLMRCMIWYHFYNLKNVENIHEGLLLLVQLQDFNFTKSNTLPWVFFMSF